MKYMRKIWNLGIGVLVFGTMTSCSSGTESGDYLRSEEEKLIEHCRHIDTSAVSKIAGVEEMKKAAQLDQITADSWILIEEEQGLLLSSKNADKKQYPASLTKMMTCALVLENGHFEDTVNITNDVYKVRDGRVKLGDGFLVRDLLNEMMLQSDNDAAYALAQKVAGDILAFCKMMNDRAAVLHLDSTHFANPNGMPNDSTFSSAYDMLTLARYCMRDTAFAALVKTPSMRIPMTDGRYLDIRNTNLLLKNYKGCLGIKTGFTNQAGGCMAVAAEREGVTLYLVLLKSKSLWTRFTEAEKLLNYGFGVMKAYQESIQRTQSED